MFEYMHYHDSTGKTKNIRNKCCHEIFVTSRGSLKYSSKLIRFWGKTRDFIKWTIVHFTCNLKLSNQVNFVTKLADPIKLNKKVDQRAS